MTFLDFEQIKEDNPIDQVMHSLHLDMKDRGGQYRGACPTCKSGGDRALAITPARNSFYCFALQKGGDAISLVAHIKDISVKEAAAWLSDRSSTVPEERRVNQTKKLEPLSHLDPDHDAVLAVGFNPAAAKRLGIGYATKGIAKGNVLIPIRDEDGTLEGYVGVEELTFLPKEFKLPENVVQLKKA